MNYKAQVTPKTAKFSHGGHVHNLLNKAYQHHRFGNLVTKAVEGAPTTPINPELKHGAKLAQELMQKYKL